MSEKYEKQTSERKERFISGKTYVNLDHIMMIEVRKDSQHGEVAYIVTHTERERKVPLANLVVL